VAKELGIGEHTFGRWRNQYGVMKADDAKELRRLKDRTAGSSGWSRTRRWTSRY
jgi:hypothetical protein